MDFPPSFPVFLLSHPQEMHSLLYFFAFSTFFSHSRVFRTLFFAPLSPAQRFHLSLSLALRFVVPSSLLLYPLLNVFISPSALFCALSLFFLLFSANFTFYPPHNSKKMAKKMVGLHLFIIFAGRYAFEEGAGMTLNLILDKLWQTKKKNSSQTSLQFLHNNGWRK